MHNFRIELFVLPSWNDFLAVTRHAGAVQGMLKTWRKRGRDAAIRAAPFHDVPVLRWTENSVSESGRVTPVERAKIEPVYFTEPVGLLLYFQRPTRARYDVFSPFIKPVIDGFVDAGLLADDSTEFIPVFKIEYGGVNPNLQLSPEAKERRKIQRAGRKKRLPTPSLWSFDFYKL